ncbi:MAG: LysM peptidoglycan-binding domain-containing protein [Anaerolineales bacterium]
MPNKKFFTALFAMLFVLSTAACVRSASKAPKSAAESPSPSTESALPSPGSVDDVFGQLSSFATQTAIAMGAPATTAEATIIPEITSTGEIAPGEATPTPETQMTQETTTEAETAQATPVPNFKLKSREVPKSYTLHKGEHPYCIARRFNVNPITMLQISGLSSSGNYSTGTVLKIPQSGSFPGNRTLESHPTTYVVESGDETLYSIACLFGDVWPEDIADANGLKLNANLSVGQKLYIP